MYYFNMVLDSLENTTDYVLIYEYATCIHEMLKEIDYWVKQSSQVTAGAGLVKPFGASKTSTGGNLLDFGLSDQAIDGEDQIKMSLEIHQNGINYLRTFQVVCQKLSGLFNSFNVPNLVWKMVNFLAFILEKNTESAVQLIECLKQLNIIKLLNLNSEQVHDALIDMLKQLLAH
jgi:hypothetical protein